MEAPAAPRLALALVLVFVASLGACSNRRPVANTLVAPYDTTVGDSLWAVVPLVNQSDDALADTDRVTDALIRAIEGVDGLAAIPLTRIRVAMAGLGLTSVETPTDAQALRNAVGADAVVFGSLTSFDPYRPPRIGLSIALFGSPAGSTTLDVAAIRSAGRATDAVSTDAIQSIATRSTASVLLDAQNQKTLGELERYAVGRTDELSPWREDQHTASMDLFTEFATHVAVRELLDTERLRLVRANAGRTQNRP